MQLLFVVGTGRSGTNMVRDALNLHPDVFIPQETHWWSLLFREYGLTSNPIDRYMTIVEGCRYHEGTSTLQELLQDTSLTVDTLRQRIDERLRGEHATISEFGSVFYEIVAQENGARISGDKTPEYGMCMQIIHQLWPDAKFLHVVRDGRDVARSMAKHPGFRLMAKYGVTYWPTVAFAGRRRLPLPAEHGRTFKRLRGVSEERGFRITSFPELWAIRLNRIRDELTRIPAANVLEVRYEDIQRDKECSMEHIAEFAGLSAEATVTNTWVRAAAKSIRGRPRKHAKAQFSCEIMELLAAYGYE